jgi:hypothetical protein
MLAVAMVVAVVSGDSVALRAAPGRDAAQQAVLWRGDWLEVRGERKGWLKVYDHRHERPGWIAETGVHEVSLEASAAPELRAVVSFLRATPGAESLGIAYAGLYLKVTPAGSIEPAVLASLGDMATRLARRASTASGAAATAASAHLEVAQSWGVHFASVERDDRTHICYDGEAFRYLLGLRRSEATTISSDRRSGSLGIPSAPAVQGDDQARAALALSDDECAPPGLGATAQQAADEARLSLVEGIDPTRVTPYLGDRLRIRRAQLASSLAWTRARRGDAAGAQRAAEAAAEAYLRVDRAELADEDAGGYAEAGVRVTASHWAAAPAVATGRGAGKDPGALSLIARAGDDSDTCLALAVGGKPLPGPALRCTHGQVWTGSFRVAPDGASAALAVQPLPGWTELWMFRRGTDGWTVDIVPPSTDGPDLGYVELAGWAPDGKRALVVRESRVRGATRRTFEVMAVSTLAVERTVRTWEGLGRVQRWASTDWRGQSLAIK